MSSSKCSGPHPPRSTFGGLSCGVLGPGIVLVPGPKMCMTWATDTLPRCWDKGGFVSFGNYVSAGFSWPFISYCVLHTHPLYNTMKRGKITQNDVNLFMKGI